MENESKFESILSKTTSYFLILKFFNLYNKFRILRRTTNLDHLVQVCVIQNVY